MIIIPAFEPKKILLDLLTSLKQLIAETTLDCQIVIINDGSHSKEAKEIFCVAREQGIVILNHNNNRGKGAAIKTGINYALSLEKQWVVTADADGQHLPNDILNVINKGIEFGNSVVLGVRVFDRQTPLRSRLGNFITTKLFSLFHGGNIKDTQTGLRYIPKSYFEKFSKILYNRYEFEFASLIQTVKEDNIRQVPIQTIYEPGNPTSHFRKFVDSARIYWVFARSIVVSVGSTIVDISIFMLCQQFFESTLMSILFSRSIAIIVYFHLARAFVFKTKKETLRQFSLLTSLVLVNSLIISQIINYIYSITELNKGIVYILLTMIFYFINISIQRWIIFRD
jgi:glycosyltransferase involved in cell wall biosynthesis